MPGVSFPHFTLRRHLGQGGREGEGREEDEEREGGREGEKKRRETPGGRRKAKFLSVKLNRRPLHASGKLQGCKGTQRKHSPGDAAPETLSKGIPPLFAGAGKLGRGWGEGGRRSGSGPRPAGPAPSLRPPRGPWTPREELGRPESCRPPRAADSRRGRVGCVERPRPRAEGGLSLGGETRHL